MLQAALIRIVLSVLLLRKLLTLALISLPVFLRLLLEIQLGLLRHPLPEKTDLFHDLSRVPLSMILLQFLALLLAEEYVR